MKFGNSYLIIIDIIYHECSIPSLSLLFLQTFGVLKTEVFLVARLMYVEGKSSSTTSLSAQLSVGSVREYQ